MRLATCLLLAAALFAAPALADDKAVAQCQKEEAAARAKGAAELVKAAKALAALKAFDEAREELRRAMLVAPQDPVCRQEYGKLLGQRAATPTGLDEKILKATQPGYEACLKGLTGVLGAWVHLAPPEGADRLATTIAAGFDDDATLLKGMDFVWYEPYLTWARKTDVERWEKGDEFVDGAWLDAEKVKALDAKHADWKAPWRLNDGVHEVRTVMPLRTAKRVLERVGQFRRAALDYFAGEWDLRPPKGLLPIILTETQADFAARVAEYASAGKNSTAAAFYLRSSAPLNPCFVTFEPKDTDGSTKKIVWDGMVLALQHEVGHQIAFEYSKYAGDGQGDVPWCSEGVANYLSYFASSKGRWRLTRPAETPFATGYLPGAFAWTKANFGTIQPLSTLLGGPPKALTTAEEYMVATTLTYFLLEGEDRRRRAPTIRLTELVHQGKATSDSFAAVFGKQDFAKMQDEWKAFVDGISIETK